MLGKGKKRGNFRKEKEGAACLKHLQLELVSNTLFHASPNLLYSGVTLPKHHLYFWGSIPQQCENKRNKKQECSGLVSNREDLLQCKKAIAGPLLVRSIAEYSAQCAMWTGDFITHCWFLSLLSFHIAAALNASENGFRLVALDFL